MKVNSVFKKILINTSSQIVAKIATVIIGFLTVGLLTRYLGVEQYGVYTLVFAYLSFFGIFADFGLQLNLVKDLSHESSNSVDLKEAYFFIKISLTLLSIIFSLTCIL